MARAVGRLKREPRRIIPFPVPMGSPRPSKSRAPVRTRSIKTFGPSLDGLTVKCEVETLAFDFGRGTKTNDEIDQLEQDQ